MYGGNHYSIEMRKKWFSQAGIRLTITVIYLCFLATSAQKQRIFSMGFATNWPFQGNKIHITVNKMRTKTSMIVFDHGHQCDVNHMTLEPH